MVFEGDKAPKQWVQLAKRFRRVLVPSQHTKSSLIAAGLEEEKIVIIPHGVDHTVFNLNVLPSEKLVNNKKCTFIWNKGWSKGVNDRRGFHSVLRAFCEEFKYDEMVRLVAHINPAYALPGWNVEDEFAKLALPAKEVRAEIVVNTDVLPLNMLAPLYASGDVYVGVSKADAFNIPVLEAMACGKPVITSTFSGTTDFVPKCCWFVGGEMKPASVTDINEVAMYEQAQWLELSIPELRKALREAFTLWKENHDKLKMIGRECFEESKNWSWNASAQKLLLLIDQLEVEHV